MLGMQGRNPRWAKARTRPILRGAPAVLLLLALAGCGGEAEERELTSPPSEILTVPTTAESASPDGAAEKSRTPTAPSRADYISRADTLCARYQPRIDSLEKEAELAAKEGDFDAAADRLEKGLAESESEVAALRGLSVPKGSEAALSRIYDGIAQANRIFRGSLGELRSGDVEGFNRIGDQASLASVPSKRSAIAFGFEVCGQSG